MDKQRIKVHYTFDERTDRGRVTRSRTFSHKMEVYDPDEVVEVARTDEMTWLRLPDGRTASTSWGNRYLVNGRLELDAVRPEAGTDGRAQVEERLAGLVVVGDRLLRPEPLPWVVLTADLRLGVTQAPDDGQVSLTPAGLVAPLAQVEAVKDVVRASEQVDEHELAWWTCTEHEESGFDVAEAAAFLRQVRVVTGAAGALRESPSWDTVEALGAQVDRLFGLRR